jgi:hypothetical protein
MRNPATELSKLPTFCLNDRSPADHAHVVLFADDHRPISGRISPRAGSRGLLAPRPPWNHRTITIPHPGEPVETGVAIRENVSGTAVDDRVPHSKKTEAFAD